MNSSSSPAILLVDDNFDARDFALRVLEAAEFTVVLASSGMEAVTLARSTQFDTIFMDITLPDINGFDATRLIRFDERMQARPRSNVVALTSHTTQDYRDLARNADMDGYLTKPSLPQALIDAILRKLPGDWLFNERAAVADEEEIAVRTSMSHLIPRYLSRVHEMVDKLEANLASRNFEPMYIIGHNLKGSGATYGFKTLSLIGASMEAAAGSRDLEGVRHAQVALRSWLASAK